MNKLLIILALIIQTFTISSCVTQVSILKSLSTAKKSIVKIEAHIRPGTCAEEDETCKDYHLYATGSGAVVYYNHGKTILTAAHICKQNAYMLFGGVAEGEFLFKAIDRKNKEYIIKIIKYDIDSDICLLKSTSSTLDMPYLRMSVKEPEYAEVVYNLAGPLGIINGEMVPNFRGTYFGLFGDKAFYGIPTIGGSSGSPILNSRGELVGMIHSVHAHFHHIALSVSHKNLWNFLMIPHSHTL